MSVYMVTGKLGGGKSLATVGKIRDYLNQNRPVATNLDINIEKLVNPWAKKTRLIRLPDKPDVNDLENLPEPYTGDYDENKTGLIVLDECGTWFNTREYRDKTRQPLINKLLHIRKAGWDVMFIIQHPEMIDKQIREGIGELIVHCSRADRLGIPILSSLFGIRPPKIHLGVVKYGSGAYAPTVDRWVYNGHDLYDGYDTRQVFGANDCAIHSVLPPYTVYGQFITRSQHAKQASRQFRQKMVNFAKSAKRTAFLLGLTVGFGIFSLNASEPKSTTTIAATTENSSTTDSGRPAYDTIRITAFIRKSSSFEYIFWDDSEHDTWNPTEHGYSVRYISPCKAMLHTDNMSFELSCKSSMSEEAREREVRSPRSESSNEA